MGESRTEANVELLKLARVLFAGLLVYAVIWDALASVTTMWPAPELDRAPFTWYQLWFGTAFVILKLGGQAALFVLLVYNAEWRKEKWLLALAVMITIVNLVMLFGGLQSISSNGAGPQVPSLPEYRLLVGGVIGLIQALALADVWTQLRRASIWPSVKAVKRLLS